MKTCAEMLISIPILKIENLRARNGTVKKLIENCKSICKGFTVAVIYVLVIQILCKVEAIITV